MLLLEALKIAGSAKPSRNRKVALLSSFEPLHLKTYLQAMLAQAFPGDIPTIYSRGFDQLAQGLKETSTVLKDSPTLLCLSWEDFHPRLSWRSRGTLESPEPDELLDFSERLEKQLTEWINLRKEAETCIAIPPIEWLPFTDSYPCFAIGPTGTAVQASMWRIAENLTRRGAKIVRVEPPELNYRDLLQAGFPLSAEQSEVLARRFLDACCLPIERKKVLVTDLDGTMWHGIIGEDGPSGIQCGASGRGFPFHVFQRFLSKLRGEGVLLAFCSKNSAKDVLPLFDKLDFPLKLSDFAAHCCNWRPKSENVRLIAEELHVGLNAVVVVDDNEAEIAEISAHLPELTVLRTPRDGKEWQDLFRKLQDLFGAWRVGVEDKARTRYFMQERLRKTARPLPASIPIDGLSHLSEFKLELIVNPDAFPDPRSLELINKTNQFNLTGERITKEQWLSWSSNQGAFCLSAQLKDRFGDFGTICVLTGIERVDEIEIRQFVLSCRAFGRGVETLVLDNLVQFVSCNWVVGAFKDTGKNEPVQRFLKALGISSGLDMRWRVHRTVLQKCAANILKETGMIVHRTTDQATGEIIRNSTGQPTGILHVG